MLIDSSLNASPLIFPALECIHIIGFALSVGTITLVNFRLLGIGLLDETAAELAGDTFFWTLTGLLMMLFSGLLLFASDPDMYYRNYAFDLKMFFFLVAVAFHYTVHRRTVHSASPAREKRVAVVSIALWMCVVFGGIFIGFLNSTLDLKRI